LCIKLVIRNKSTLKYVSKSAYFKVSWKINPAVNNLTMYHFTYNWHNIFAIYDFSLITVEFLFSFEPQFTTSSQIFPAWIHVRMDIQIMDCSPLSTGILHARLQRVTIPEAIVIQFVLLKMKRVLLETCWGL